MHVRLDWIDPSGDHRWAHVDDPLEPARCRTRGTVSQRQIIDGKLYIVMAATEGRDQSYTVGDRLSIPVTLITGYIEIP